MGEIVRSDSASAGDDAVRQAIAAIAALVAAGLRPSNMTSVSPQHDAVVEGLAVETLADLDHLVVDARVEQLDMQLFDYPLSNRDPATGAYRPLEFSMQRSVSTAIPHRGSSERGPIAPYSLLAGGSARIGEIPRTGGLERVVDGLDFPVWLTSPADDPRLFVVEKFVQAF